MSGATDGYRHRWLKVAASSALAAALAACGGDDGASMNDADGGGGTDAPSAADSAAESRADARSGVAPDTGSDAGADAGPCDTDPLCQANCCALPDQRCASFVATGDTIGDAEGNLIWRRRILSPETIDQASASCSGWGGRLPTQAELLHFIDTAMPCADQIAFPEPPEGQCVWTSTKDAQNSSLYECVFFDGTLPMSGPASDSHWVICTR